MLPPKRKEQSISRLPWRRRRSAPMNGLGCSTLSGMRSSTHERFFCRGKTGSPHAWPIRQGQTLAVSLKPQRVHTSQAAGGWGRRYESSLGAVPFSEPAGGCHARVEDGNDGSPMKLLFKASRRNASLPQFPQAAGFDADGPLGNSEHPILNVCRPQGKRFFADSSVFFRWRKRTD